MANRSQHFRNPDAGDTGLRDLERRVRATGDVQDALRYGSALRRAGQLDRVLVDAMRELSDQRQDELLAAWVLATGGDRIRLYRALNAAGIRYPDAAFLSALSRLERFMCCTVACMGAPRWLRRVEGFGLRRTYRGPLEIVHGGDLGGGSNQGRYTGREGLERARVEGARIEASWAPLVRVLFEHRDGGFAEHMLFLTPDGYALREVQFQGDGDPRFRCGVVSWGYAQRNGLLLPATGDDLSSRHGGHFASAVHALEVRVQRLLDQATPQSMLSHHPGESAVSRLTHQACREAGAERKLTHRDQYVGDHHSGQARCLIVAVPTTGVPSVTIGITNRSEPTLTSRVRAVTPAHFWGDLAPWKQGKKLDARLAAWAADDQPDRVRVEDGNVAFVWSQWAPRMHEELEQLARGQAQPVDLFAGQGGAHAVQPCVVCGVYGAVMAVQDGHSMCQTCALLEQQGGP